MTAPRKWKAPKARLLESTGLKTALLFAGLVALGIGIAVSDLRPDLSHLHNTLLSGSEQGVYYRTARSLADAATRQEGSLAVVATAGSVENLTRLAAEATTCESQFALVQDGMDWSRSPSLELIGRLRKAESLFLLGRTADRITRLADLKGMRIGVGPEGSGAAHIARSVLEGPALEPLGLILSHHALEEQLDLLERGALDLGVFVMDEDAPLVSDAVTRRGLQIAGLQHIDVIARRLPFTRVGRIGAGQYDPVAVLPAEDKRVLRVDTLVVGNGCANRAQTLALLALVSDQMPDFIRHNRETPNATGLRLAPESREFFEQQGLGFVDTWFPWIGNIMPPGNWVHVIFAVSVLFNLMGIWNRFRLWRIDANRVAAERVLPLLFGPNVTLEELATMPLDRVRERAQRERLDDVIARLEALAERSRRQSLSVLVPMGAEMAYRYQERLMGLALTHLRALRKNLE